MTFNGRDFDDWHRSAAGTRPYRLADQDRDGVVAEMLFATVGMPLCGHPDLDYRRACMDRLQPLARATTAPLAPDRLYGAGQAAIKNAADGVDRTGGDQGDGFKAVMMSGMPGEADYDDPSYDRLWAAAVEMDLPLCFHILTNPPTAATAARRSTRCSTSYATCQDIIGMLVFSGVFDRFPELKVVCVESDAGWAPHYAYRMDHIYNRHRFWNKTAGALAAAVGVLLRQRVA